MTDPVISSARRHGLADIARRSARRMPHKTALVDGEVRLTFAELDRAVDSVAAALSARGLGKGDALALLSHNCWQFPVLVLAAARAGVVLVPINFMLNGSEIAYILEHSEAVALVAEDALVPTAEQALAQGGAAVRLRGTIRLEGTVVGDAWEDVDDWARHDPAQVPDVDLDDDDPIRLMYTSGTESRPKGALLSSRSLLWQYVSCISTGGMEPGDVEVHTMPLYHCAQLDNFLMTDIYLGATSIILRRPEPTAILAAIEREGATNLFCPPTVWISIMNDPTFTSTDLSSLRKGYYGASAMPVEVLHEMGRRLPDMRFWNFYGQTEMASLATALPPEDQLEHGGSAGFPALNVETRVVGWDGTPLPTGEVGEIVHRSPHATLGYFKDPDKTAEAFQGGWFHSGDLGYLDEGGRLYVVDRKKDMIKTGGENVASREVEEVLYEHPAVAEVAVFGVDHPRWIEAITAAVVARPGARVDEAELLAHCRARLAGYKTPKYVVVLDELPKNPSGKILKRTLRQEFADLARDASTV